MNKVTVAAIIIILAAFGGLIAWASLNSNDKTDYTKFDARSIIEASEENGNIGDHVRGKADSKVIVVEYADPQCPGCGSMMPKMHKIYENYGDRVAFVFRHFPLSYHQNARAASAAVESAGEQGYYWEMLETLYDNQNEWESIYDTQKRTDIFSSYFVEITDGKGDVDKFVSELSSTNIQKKIDFDRNLGKNNDKVNATPSIFVNGELVNMESEKPIEDLIEEMINKELKANGIETGPKTKSEE